MSDKNTELEQRAVALFTQYGFLIPRPVKEFFHELADFLNWQKLKEGIK